MHTVTATKLTCFRARPVCTVVYAKGQTVSLHGPEAKDAFDALGQMGVRSDRLTARTVTRLSCTADDAHAHAVPATGDDVAGFTCRWR